ncbi:RimJ/RimL family protein N-acetyltransferase [Agromyces terreus]|uniref:RimJ/RimL family protein N-acetyltransferase n=1 Tax=Agromyces terreus TaxID=424795 RepID=A0A9X2H0D3_9MICO|nr:GNAT family protein [Agromyces terreus]MCP2370218.1 RimJ/RimL family protein N-acetyltransferase [Agromyces terreus]
MTAATPSFDGPPQLALPFDLDDPRFEPIETARLVLRPLEASDARDVWEYQRLPEVLRYIPWPERSPAEGRAHTEKRAGLRRLESDEDAVFFAMELVGEPRVREPRIVEMEHERADAAGWRVIGDVMLRADRVEHGQLEIGWVVHPDFQGRGLAREGADAIMRLAFDTLRAHRVHALLDARNAASAALCERLGMRREATILEEEYNDGEWQDTAMYGILRREWAGRPAVE